MQESTLAVIVWIQEAQTEYAVVVCFILGAHDQVADC